MKIKTDRATNLTKADINKIRKLVTEVNGKKEAHTFSVYDLYHIGDWAEERLSRMGVPKKYRNGTTIEMESSEDVSGRYKYSRDGNLIKLVRGSKNWYITSLELVGFGTSDGGKFKVRLSEDGQKSLLQSFAKEHSLELV